jgi:hypothetical protein
MTCYFVKHSDNFSFNFFTFTINYDATPLLPNLIKIRRMVSKALVDISLRTCIQFVYCVQRTQPWRAYVQQFTVAAVPDSVKWLGTVHAARSARSFTPANVSGAVVTDSAGHHSGHWICKSFIILLGKTLSHFFCPFMLPSYWKFQTRETRFKTRVWHMGRT